MIFSASRANIDAANLNYPYVSAHLMRVSEAAHWLKRQDWTNPILRKPFSLASGHLLTPDRPGAGIA
jgi:mandelate racemase